MQQNNSQIITQESVLNCIYEIQGIKIMFDLDLAVLYETENRSLKQAVKRNIIRFTEDFMFQLSKDEWKEVITNCDNLPWNLKFSPTPPLAFTEQGTAMLSSILSSERAVLVNIEIIRVFTRIKNYLTEHVELKLEIEKIKKAVGRTDQNLEIIFQYLEELISISNL